MLTFIPSIFFEHSGRSLMYTMNSSVQETAPCEGPIFYYLYFDSDSSNHTLTHLCARNIPNQLSMFPLTMYILSLLINLLLQAVSVNTARVLFVWLNPCFTFWTNLIIHTYIHTHTHTYHFIDPQILSYNSRT